MAKPDSVSKNPTLSVNYRLVLAGAIVLIYLVACFCPALRMDKYYSGNSIPQSSETWFGWMALLLGWTGVLMGSFAWLANFVLWLSLIFLLYGLRWASLISSGLTILISLDLFPLFWTNIPADEGGVGRAVLRPLEIGAWLWFASIAAAFVCACILFLAPRKGV